MWGISIFQKSIIKEKAIKVSKKTKFGQKFDEAMNSNAWKTGLMIFTFDKRMETVG